MGDLQFLLTFFHGKFRWIETCFSQHSPLEKRKQILENAQTKPFQKCHKSFGMAGAGGAYFNSEGIKLKEYAQGIDRKTNNGIEWLALIKGLDLARNDGIEELVVFGDSSMVIGKAWKLMRNRKNPVTKTHHLLKCIVNDYKAINFLHVLRENNKQADIMANKGVGLDCVDLF